MVGGLQQMWITLAMRNKPVSAAGQSALDLKANAADVTTSVDLTTALDLKAPSPAFAKTVTGVQEYGWLTKCR
jgi:hypothetical protein